MRAPIIGPKSARIVAALERAGLGADDGPSELNSMAVGNDGCKGCKVDEHNSMRRLLDRVNKRGGARKFLFSSRVYFNSMSDRICSLLWAGQYRWYVHHWFFLVDF